MSPTASIPHTRSKILSLEKTIFGFRARKRRSRNSLPVSYYHISSGDSCPFPAVMGDQSLFKNPPSGFFHFCKNPDYFISESFGYFGSIQVPSKESVLTIGPVFSTPVSDAALHSFMLEWAISSDRKEDLSQILSTIPLLSINQFLQTLAYLHLCLNDEKIDIGSHFGLENTNVVSRFSTIHSNEVIRAKETQHFHNTYFFERQLTKCIQDGDLADLYIQECERSQDIAHISTLNYTMLTDFTERVSQTKIPQGMSPEVFKCIQFISHHINEPIQVGDVAEHIGRSRSYLTNKFKKELGFDVSSFIMRCRLEEAKSLLTYSDKTLSEISTYLCFSSQSYFQNIFKKKYGITPLKYRKQTQRV